jgi:septal ring factor EnvC (AmiA/AmiB activator)
MNTGTQANKAQATVNGMQRKLEEVNRQLREAQQQTQALTVQLQTQKQEVHFCYTTVSLLDIPAESCA